MALLFQLFSLDDLRQLSAAHLEELRAYVGTQQRAPEPRVVAAVTRLMRAEYTRLTGRVPRGGILVNDPRQGLLAQVFHAEDLDVLDHQAYTLLTWVMECALLHDPAAVQAVADEARQLFLRWTGRTPNGPDLPRVTRQVAHQVTWPTLSEERTS
jgi:hypothetical protein